MLRVEVDADLTRAGGDHEDRLRDRDAAPRDETEVLEPLGGVVALGDPAPPHEEHHLDLAFRRCLVPLGQPLQLLIDILSGPPAVDEQQYARRGGPVARQR
ncbi:MAG TPA: hypothetical protein VH142_02980, partial [Polyangiaceae bacterium]|nr:hypothetical protein [Polyangiaceae bacterium]